MSALLDSNPEYRSITIIRVDWDRFSRAPIVRELRIPRRSTLVMFKDGKEIARVVAQVARPHIEALFKAAM